MSAAIISLSLVALALGVGLVLAVRWGMTAKDEANTAGDLLRGTRELVATQAIEIQSLKQQLATAKTLAAIAQKQRNDAKAASDVATVKKIKDASTPKEAAAAVNEAMPRVVVDMKPITELK